MVLLLPVTWLGKGNRSLYNWQKDSRLLQYDAGLSVRVSANITKKTTVSSLYREGITSFNGDRAH